MVPRVDGVPAWRRLGLVLKNEDQSSTSVPECSPCRSDAQHVPTHYREKDLQENTQPPSKLAINGKSPKLGKSRREVKVAETLKESNTSFEKDSAQKATVIEESNVTDAAVVVGHGQDKDDVQPKGDSNYRKKKAKPKPRGREDHNGAPSKSSPAQFALSAAENLASDDRPTLLASTETDFIDSVPLTPSRSVPSNDRNTSDTPARRKRVSFTPDTKTEDGNSGQTLFKRRIAELKGQEPDSGAAPTPQTGPTSNGSKSLTSADSSTANGKKKVPSLYLAYLMQYFTDRNHWKFNKAKQNYVVDNALNIFRIPEDHSDALLAYISGLKGAGVIARLRERCEASLNDMNDAEAREQVKEEALQERVSRERKRRKVEGDIETLHDHPHGDSYIRKLQRKRAEALLMALGRTAPIIPNGPSANGIHPSVKHLPPLTRDSRKRKRRGEVSSDESSSDSSSEEDSSSSESDSDSDSGSDSDSASTSESGSENSDSDSSSENDSEGDTSSESDSDDEHPTSSNGAR